MIPAILLVRERKDIRKGRASPNSLPHPKRNMHRQMHFIYERQRISVVKNPIKGESSVLTDERCAGNTGCRFTDDKLLFPGGAAFIRMRRRKG